MIINGQALLEGAPIKNMKKGKVTHKPSGLTYGLTETGYDVRIKEGFWLHPFHWKVKLGSTIEQFQIPENWAMTVHNKSTNARMGICASKSTTGEPFWRGHLTLELSLTQLCPVFIRPGQPIATCWFHELKEPQKYWGRYQDQPSKPVPAKLIGRK